jgi:hypothetical protein
MAPNGVYSARVTGVALAVSSVAIAVTAVEAAISAPTFTVSGSDSSSRTGSCSRRSCTASAVVTWTGTVVVAGTAWTAWTAVVKTEQGDASIVLTSMTGRTSFECVKSTDTFEDGGGVGISEAQNMGIDAGIGSDTDDA